MTDREAFELAMKDASLIDPTHDCAKDQHGTYYDDYLHGAWDGWQAALASERAKQTGPELRWTGNYLQTVANRPTAAQAQMAQQAEPVALPFRKSLERLLDDAEHPKGMSIHDGKARVPADWIRYLLARIDAAPPAVQAEPVAFPGGPRMGSTLQRLAARLVYLLDDDQWNNIEPILQDFHAEAAPPAVQGEPVAWWIDPPYLDGNHITTDPYEPVRLAARSDVTVRPLVFGNATPPAVQAEWDEYGLVGSDSWRACKKAAPPADDEAVRLLREAREMLEDFVLGGIVDRIDAYLAKVGK